MIKPTSKNYLLAHLKYRPDVDGLRGKATLLIVGYHAYPCRMAGGFIGVDIFVISVL